MENKLRFLLATATILSSVAAHAENNATDMITQSGKALGSVMDEIIAIEAKIKKIEKEKQLTELLEGDVDSYELPIVQNVTFSNGEYSAKVMFSNGMLRTIKKGEMLGADLHVVKVDKSGVMVRDIKRNASTYLPFEKEHKISGMMPQNTGGAPLGGNYQPVFTPNKQQ